MTFIDELKNINIEYFLNIVENPSSNRIPDILHNGVKTPEDFCHLISEQSIEYLENMAELSQKITLKRFGKIISLYAPIYLSNECVSTCVYCGYSKNNPLKRKTLSFNELESECVSLKEKGFEDILLVAGEHKKIVNLDYLKNSIEIANKYFPLVSVEVEPLSEDDYTVLHEAGCCGVVTYQETYNRNIYKKVHLGGRKKDYDFRLKTLERAASAGIRFLGLGSLLGLNNWREEALYMYFHIKYLYKHFWKSLVSVSVPRIRSSFSNYGPPYKISDTDIVQLITSLRITFPDIGIVLSTRERPDFRDRLNKLGITRTSAGSRTEPGGYIVSEPDARQFEVEDKRSVEEVAESIRNAGYEPVWKIWDRTLI